MMQSMRALLALALAMAALVVVGGPAHADGGHNGTVDVLSSPAAGLLRVRGWVYDYDDGYAPVRLHLYVGGTFSDPNAQFFDLGVTDVARPDVPTVHAAAGPTTGFDRTVEVTKYGSQQIFLYALNAVGSVGDPGVLVGGTAVTINDPNPDGQFFSATSPAPGQVSVTGAAVQVDGTEKTRVAITTNGTLAGTLVADQRGPGFEDFPIMFTGTVPSPGGDVTVCATAINQAAGRDKDLGCKQVQVAPVPAPVPVPVPPVVDPVPPPPPAPTPTITLGLRAVKKKSRLRVDIGPDLDQSNYRFTVQRRSGTRWRTIRRTQTLGAQDVSVLNLPRGRYRVVVPRQHDLAGTRAEVRLRR